MNKQNVKPNQPVLWFYIICGSIALILTIYHGNSGYPEVAIPFLIGVVFFWVGAYPAAMFQAEKKFRKVEEQRFYEEKIQEERNIIIAEKKRNQQIYKDFISDLENKYGLPSKTINFGDEIPLQQNVICYNDHKIIVINGKIISFSEILSSTLIDNKKVIPGTTTYRTTTDNSDMLGRASIGYLLDGNRGLQIGAQTSARDTVVRQEADTHLFNYEITLTINSLEAPIERINIGNNKNIAEELQALFIVILNRNKQTN